MGTGVESGGGPAGSQVPTPAGAPRLELGLLGELSVRVDGDMLTLPRSRKCRALIAYLATTGRPHRRDRLCELFWEVPDDPRGALRWSLSKIRRVLGDALITDGDNVALDRRAVSIDVAELRNAAERPGTLDTAGLETLAGRCGRGFGEDLDLPRCLEFQGWLIATREDVRQAQLAILGELLRRLGGEPERALAFARMRVDRDPLSEQARLDLLAILAAAGRAEEAERQRLLAVELLSAEAIPVPAALARPLVAAKPAPAKPSFQRIRFRTAPDGTRIAWSAVGAGPPLVKTANWMGHLDYEWESPLLRHWLTELSRERTLIRYDARGNGLSDRGAADLSLDAFVQDLETVTADLDEAVFDLIGISQGCPVAIAFAARHPARVRKLVLFGGFAAGWRHSRSDEVRAQWTAMITLAGMGWGMNNPAFRQMFTSLFAPRAPPEQADWFNQLQRVSATPAEAQRLLGAIGAFDAREMLGRVEAPTIVFHCRGDALVPFEAGRHLAAGIPGAEFVGLDSDNHLPLADEPAWAILVEQLRRFLSR